GPRRVAVTGRRGPAEAGHYRDHESGGRPDTIDVARSLQASGHAGRVIPTRVPIVSGFRPASAAPFLLSLRTVEPERTLHRDRLRAVAAGARGILEEQLRPRDGGAGRRVLLEHGDRAVAADALDDRRVMGTVFGHLVGPRLLVRLGDVDA